MRGSENPSHLEEHMEELENHLIMVVGEIKRDKVCFGGCFW